MGPAQVAQLIDHAQGTLAAKANGPAVQPAKGALGLCPPPAPSCRLEKEQGIDLIAQRTVREPLEVVAEFGVLSAPWSRLISRAGHRRLEKGMLTRRTRDIAASPALPTRAG